MLVTCLCDCLQWEAFSIPELKNFLTILNREEDEYVDQIKAKYSLMQIHLTRRMTEIHKQRQQQAAATDVTAAAVDDVTQRLRDSTLRDNTPPPAPPAASAPVTSAPAAGVKSRKLKKADVHKDTPRPGEIPGGQSLSHQGHSVQGQSDQARGVTFTEDEREGVFV